MPNTELPHPTIQGSRLGAATRLLRSLSLAAVLASGLVMGLSASTASASSDNPIVVPTFGPGDHAPIIGIPFPTSAQTIAFYVGAKSRRKLTRAALTSSTHHAPGTIRLYARGSGGGGVTYSIWPGPNCGSASACQNAFGQVCSVNPNTGVVQFHAAGACVVSVVAKPVASAAPLKYYRRSAMAFFRSVSIGAPVTTPVMVLGGSVSDFFSTITTISPTAPANGTLDSIVTVTLRDEAGNFVVAAPVSLERIDGVIHAAAPGSTLGFGPYEGWVLTDARGRAVFDMGAATPGSVTVRPLVGIAPAARASGSFCNSGTARNSGDFCYGSVSVTVNFT